MNIFEPGSGKSNAVFWEELTMICGPVAEKEQRSRLLQFRRKKKREKEKKRKGGRF